MLDYIIVQAGGKGTRMESLTRNKPKALVPVENLPMIFHLFHKYPDKKYIIIGDYKYDVLERYLKAFAEVDYKMVCATGKNGTCAGLSEAVSYIPDNEKFMLIWCDLILPKDFELLDSKNNVIGISKDFPCRWKYENNELSEERSTEFGVAGYFIFNDRSYLKDVPDEGEFVRWLKSKKYIFDEQPLYHTHEYGLYSEWSKLPVRRCRPFNDVQVIEDKVYKRPIAELGKELAVREAAWYRKIIKSDFANIPAIYSYEPLCMEYINGKNVYECTELSKNDKTKILTETINCLKQIHSLEHVPVDINSYKNAYLDKTYNRLEKVRELVPFANDESIIVNGRQCRNIFYHKDEIEKQVMGYIPNEFCLIHGDCTFSNTMLEISKKTEEVLRPVLIDPRGYFGHTEFYGDSTYDWVKLYYSLFSNYDQFNLKRFSLEIGDNEVHLNIASNKWEDMEDTFFELLDGEVNKKQIKLLLALVWLSLTTYAWEDYDSICGAFYNGLYYLEEVL